MRAITLLSAALCVAASSGCTVALHRDLNRPPATPVHAAAVRSRDGAVHVLARYEREASRVFELRDGVVAPWSPAKKDQLPPGTPLEVECAGRSRSDHVVLGEDGEVVARLSLELDPVRPAHRVVACLLTPFTLAIDVALAPVTLPAVAAMWADGSFRRPESR